MLNDLIVKTTKDPTEENILEMNTFIESMGTNDIIKDAHLIMINPYVNDSILESACNETSDVNLMNRSIEVYESCVIQVESINNIPDVEKRDYARRLTNLKFILESRLAKDKDLVYNHFATILESEYDHELTTGVLESAGGSEHSHGQLEILFALEVAKLEFKTQSDEEVLESLSKLNNIAYKYSFILESAPVNEAFERFKKKTKAGLKQTKSAVSKGTDVAVKGGKASAKVAGKTKDIAVKGGNASVKIAGKTIEKGTDTAEKGLRAIPKTIKFLADNTIGRIKHMDKDARRTAMLDGGMKTKILRLLRMIVAGGAGFALGGPLIGSLTLGITLLVTNTIDNGKDTKARKQLIGDLEQELKITKEKIRDSDANGDKQAKYQLMRIENALERDIERLVTHTERTTARATDREMVK